MAELIHTCYRIGDIDRSVAFYEALGFEEIGRLPIRDEAISSIALVIFLVCWTLLIRRR